MFRDLALVGLLVASGAGCHASTNEVVIGAAGPWTAGYTQMTYRGIELGVADANARALPGSRTLRVAFADDSGDGTHAVEVAERFAGDPTVVGVVGHLNSGAMVSAARVYDGRLAAISPAASAPEVSGISSWVFRTIPSDSANGAALGRFASRLGRRAAVLYENDSYGRGLAAAFRQHYDGAVVSVDAIGTTPADMEPFVSYYAQVSHPDLVFVAGLQETGSAFLKQARRQQLATQFLGGDGWAGVAVDTAAAEGVYVGVPFNPATPGAQAFIERFRRRFGREPDGYAAMAYDATMLLAEAVGAVGVNRGRVRDFLATTRTRAGGGYAGVTGLIGFNAQGDPEGRAVTVTRVQRGALVPVDGTR